MPQPFDYSLTVQNPAASVTQGIQKGIGLAQGLTQVKQARTEATAAAQANERKTAFNADLAKISAAPTAAGYASLAARYPEFGKVLKEGYDVLGAEEQKQNLADASSVYSALAADEPEYAEELLTKQAEALRNGGREQEAKAREDLARLVKLSPDTARTSAGLYLSTVMGPEKFVEGFSKLESDRRSRDLEGATLTEAEAKADKAAVAAKFAESEAALELQKKGYDIEKIKNDIQVSRANVRIAAMNAELAKELNAQRAELLRSRIADAQIKRDADVRDRVANAESARGQIDNFLNTADRALATPFNVIENATGSVDSRLITLRQSTADFEELIDTLGSQAFLAQAPNLKGMGALSNAEGEKLQTALQNLKLRQSPERLVNNLREAQRLLLKARDNISTRYGVPETVPDTPAAAPSDQETNALLDQYLFGGEPIAGDG
jgi:hypothetical protein